MSLNTMETKSNVMSFYDQGLIRKMCGAKPSNLFMKKRQHRSKPTQDQVKFLSGLEPVNVTA